MVIQKKMSPKGISFSNNIMIDDLCDPESGGKEPATTKAPPINARKVNPSAQEPRCPLLGSIINSYKKSPKRYIARSKLPRMRETVLPLLLIIIRKQATIVMIVKR